jgi:hypothetical protein
MNGDLKWGLLPISIRKIPYPTTSALYFLPVKNVFIDFGQNILRGLLMSGFGFEMSAFSDITHPKSEIY